MSAAQHTPGPWRWEINEKHKQVHLVGGDRPKYDLTILEPIRWGMGRATFFLRDTAHDGLQLLHKLHERRDWIEPFEGRAHHADWCANVVHPDMRLIAAAPDLLAALKRCRFDSLNMSLEDIEFCRAAIGKAEGSGT